MNETTKQNNQLVGDRIKKIRQRLGLSMAEFGALIDSKTKSGTVNNWESGKNLPNNRRLVKIANLGNTSVDELLYGTPKDYIDLAEKYFQKLLDSQKLSSHEKKALNFFDKTQHKELLVESIKRAMASPLFNGKIEKNTDGLFLIILSTFLEKYEETVRTNENLAIRAKRALYNPLEENYKEIESYQLPTEPVNEKGILYVSVLADGVDDNFMQEIQDLNKTYSQKVDQLLNKYPKIKENPYTSISYFDFSKMHETGPTYATPIATVKNRKIKMNGVNKKLETKMIDLYEAWKKLPKSLKNQTSTDEINKLSFKSKENSSDQL